VDTVPISDEDIEHAIEEARRRDSDLADLLTAPTESVPDRLRDMLARHPGLSERQASTGAGLSSNTVTRILNGDIVRPSPQTLEALTEACGTDADYYALMEAAGYKVPVAPNLENVEEGELLAAFRSMDEEDQARLLDVARVWSGRDA